uniref:2,3,5,6-tetrachlorobenzoquinone reductase n=1 Tax=Sphingobium chlorophenolicum TaxID=46429 RepID=M9WIZ7_SPHCR|nr:2,3,5,6-tetrachlorobenzoquinone reductase [Sphingobium chlorophenolicum]
MTNPVSTIDMTVTQITRVAKDINSYELRPEPGVILPEFTAGAHIGVSLPNGIQRSYSLVNPQGERDRYVITVNLDRNSRGGSRYLHEQLRVGQRLSIVPPANNFALVETAPHSVLFAGGIGITPIWSMIQRLRELGSTWELHYACRGKDFVAYRQELEQAAAEAGARFHLHLDEEADGKFLDLAGPVAQAGQDSIFYCCGPEAMLQAYKAATADLPSERVRFEHFGAALTGEPADDVFTVMLARSGQEFTVEPGMTILETLLQNGISRNYSCTQGVCGTCETKVLEGEPDHRDWVLSDEKKASNSTMLICCSLSKSPRLVLDI